MTMENMQEPTYCSVEDVEETLDLFTPDDPLGTFRFSDMSHPTYSRVEKLILSAEDEIDRRTRRTWRENRVVDYIADIRDYWLDQNGLRSQYFQNGGDYVQLRRNVREWDPSKGDKLEYRTRQNAWVDITDTVTDGEGGAWFDYTQGKLYLRTRRWQQRNNAVRVTYRYGSAEPVPMGINRLACLIVSSQIVNMGVYDIKVGLGGDISGIKNQLLDNWNAEMGRLYSSFQKSGAVHSMLR